MRILMIAPQPFYEDRGTPIVLRRLIQAITINGHQVDLITFPIGTSVPIEGLRIFRIGTFLKFRHIPIGFSIKKLILDAFLLPAMMHRLRRDRYDCLHAVEEAAFVGLLAARLHRLPILYDMQSSLPEQLESHKFLGLAMVQPVLRRLERLLLQRVDLVVCSVGLKGYVQRIASATPVREWQYPPVDAAPPVSTRENFSVDLDIPTDSFVVLYTGNFEAYQGVDRLVEAIPLIQQEIPKSVFVFVGATAGDSVPGLNTLSDVMAAVRVIPRQPQEHMATFFRAAHVVVSPRLAIGNLPLKVFDYMASGKPIVATDSPAHREVLDETSAVLVEHSPAAIAAGIVLLYKNPGLAERLADTAYRRALKERGWPVFVGDIAGLYSAMRNTTGPA
jgi:glycosyltransferase involved in cell wall biosynthesis